MSQGRFITVEGIEGAGKSTCLDVIRERLARAGIPAVFTREPGGTPLGEEIRALLLGHRHSDMAGDTELLLMFAARAQHLAQKILPAVSNGAWVVSDRFTDATYAYQGGGRGISRQRIAVLEQWVQGAFRPDLTLLLDLPVAVGLERAALRGAPDRFEAEQADFFEQVRARYRKRAADEPERIKIVDSSKSLPEVEEQVRSIIDHFVDRE